MAYDVRNEIAAPRQLAAVRARTTQQNLSNDIRRLLDNVWPELRQQGVRTGCNVVVYFNSDDGTLTIEAGVETPEGFEPTGTVTQAATPAGEVAVATHFGAYSELGRAYAALEQWLDSKGRRAAGVNWEVYGDWDEDPAKVRTDVYFLLAAED